MTELYRKADQPTETRVRDLLDRMDLREKMGQMRSIWLVLDEFGNHKTRSFENSPEDDAEKLRKILATGIGQISRAVGTLNSDAQIGVRGLNSLQKYLVEETRLGIPAISHEEGLSGLMVKGATLFPSALAYGATFDPDLIEVVGEAIGAEARSIGCRQCLAPVLDVARDPRWGRTEESLGEDPYHVGVLASRYVKGLQGRDRDLLATLKHYAAHSASEGGRNHAPVHLGWRELNDVFLLPFEMAVKLANAGSIMPAYHDIDGEPGHASAHLLTNVLRREWGFDGLVVADYGGIAQLFVHHGVASDYAEAAAMAYKAGIDIELPNDECNRHLVTALDRGLISLEDIDAVVGRILTEKVRLGLFEKPYVDDGAIRLQSPETVALARQVATRAITILDNNGILPITGTKKLAVIGPTADDPLAVLGDYSFPVHLIWKDMEEAVSSVITPLQGLQAAFGAEQVIYARGCNILDERRSGSPLFPGDVDDSTSLRQASRISTSHDLIPEAIAAARASEVAIVCVGDLSGVFQTGTVGEGSDTDSLELPGVQLDLLKAVVETGVPVVVVLSSGRPYNLGGLEDRVAAQVMTYFGGQEAGPALADVLTGRYDPSGRLPISVPRSAGALPYYYNHKFKSPGSAIARHFGSRYPFGHGMSYTSFDYRDLHLERDTVASESGTVRLSCTIRNTGPRSGIAVPQLYVRDELASVVRPVKELKAFGRLELTADSRARITFEVPTDMLNLTDYSGKRVVEPGFFTLMIGQSSADILLRTRIELVGPRRVLGKDWRMESSFSWTQEAT